MVKKYLEYINLEDNYNKNIIIKDEILGDSIFNIKKIANKNYFSMILDKDALNIEFSISELMEKIIGYFNNNYNFYTINDEIFFTEKW